MTLAFRDGDFSVRLPNHWTGLEGKIADALNDVVAANHRMAEQLARESSALAFAHGEREDVRRAIDSAIVAVQDSDLTIVS